MFLRFWSLFGKQFTRHVRDYVACCVSVKFQWFQFVVFMFASVCLLEQLIIVGSFGELP